MNESALPSDLAKDGLISKRTAMGYTVGEYVDFYDRNGDKKYGKVTKKQGEYVDFYDRNGDKKYGKVTKKQGGSVWIKDPDTNKLVVLKVMKEAVDVETMGRATDKRAVDSMTKKTELVATIDADLDPLVAKYDAEIKKIYEGSNVLATVRKVKSMGIPAVEFSTQDKNPASGIAMNSKSRTLIDIEPDYDNSGEFIEPITYNGTKHVFHYDLKDKGIKFSKIKSKSADELCKKIIAWHQKNAEILKSVAQ